MKPGVEDSVRTAEVEKLKAMFMEGGATEFEVTDKGLVNNAYRDQEASDYQYMIHTQCPARTAKKVQDFLNEPVIGQEEVVLQIHVLQGEVKKEKAERNAAMEMQGRDWVILRRDTAGRAGPGEGGCARVGYTTHIACQVISPFNETTKTFRGKLPGSETAGPPSSPDVVSGNRTATGDKFARVSLLHKLVDV